MKLVGDLKKKVEKAGNLAEAKQEIAQAGMELTDEEMAKVAGGTGTGTVSAIIVHHLCEDCLHEWDGPTDEYICPACGREWTYVTDFYQ